MNTLTLLSDAKYFEEGNAKFAELRTLLDSKHAKEKLEAMKRLMAMVTIGRDVSSFFADVVKNVGVESQEVKKLVYMYLIHYAEQNQELALLSINSFQKDLVSHSQRVRANAMKAMASIRLPVAVPLVILALKSAVKDPSSYVRRAAATAIPKVFSVDPDQHELLLELIVELLSQNEPLVLGSTLYAFNIVCPDRLDLIHAHFRKICHLLADFDEWGQIITIELLLRYGRTQFLAPAQGTQDAAAAAKAKAGLSGAGAAAGEAATWSDNIGSPLATSASSSAAAAAFPSSSPTAAATAAAASPRAKAAAQKKANKNFYSDDEEDDDNDAGSGSGSNSDSGSDSHSGSSDSDSDGRKKKKKKKSKASSSKGKEKKGSAAAADAFSALSSFATSAQKAPAAAPSGSPRSSPESERELDEDHRLLLKQASQLLQSSNTGVIVAVASLMWALAPRDELFHVVRPLVRLSRNKRNMQYVVLTIIASMTASNALLFRPYLKDFFVFAHEPRYIKLLKLDILAAITSENSIGVVLREIAAYTLDPDKTFVIASIVAIGRIAQQLPPIAQRCIRGLMNLVRTSSDSGVIAQSIVVIRQLLQSNASTISASLLTQLALLLDASSGVTSPEARLALVFIVGEYRERIPKIAPDVLRKLCATFATEADTVKAQILNLALKLFLSNSRQTSSLFKYIMDLAKYDKNIDIRDRARMMRTIFFKKKAPAGADAAAAPVRDPGTDVKDHFKSVLLTEKPAPSVSHPWSATGRDQWILGTMSHVLNQKVTGYKELPSFPLVAPDPTTRQPKVAPSVAEIAKIANKAQEKQNKKRNAKKGRRGSGSESGSGSGSDSDGSQNSEFSTFGSESEASSRSSRSRSRGSRSSRSRSSSGSASSSGSGSSSRSRSRGSGSGSASSRSGSGSGSDSDSARRRKNTKKKAPAAKKKSRRPRSRSSSGSRSPAARSSASAAAAAAAASASPTNGGGGFLDLLDLKGLDLSSGALADPHALDAASGGFGGLGEAHIEFGAHGISGESGLGSGEDLLSPTGATPSARTQNKASAAEADILARAFGPPPSVFRK